MSKSLGPRTAAGVAPTVPAAIPNITSDQKYSTGDATKEHLDRLAALVADGRIELPSDLPRESMQRLITLVRERHRHRLVMYIARCIAVDILKTGDSAKDK